MRQLPAAILVLAAAVLFQAALQRPTWAAILVAVLLGTPLVLWGMASLAGLRLPAATPHPAAPAAATWVEKGHVSAEPPLPRRQRVAGGAPARPDKRRRKAKRLTVQAQRSRKPPAERTQHRKDRPTVRRKLPADLRAQVSVIAHLEGLRPGQVVEQAVRDYLARRQAA